MLDLIDPLPVIGVTIRCRLVLRWSVLSPPKERVRVSKSGRVLVIRSLVQLEPPHRKIHDLGKRWLKPIL